MRQGDKREEKLADFGRATSPLHPVRHDPLLCAGDQRFAPPEQLYPNENPVRSIDGFLKARAGDLYNLGSIMHYLVTKRMITPEILSRIDPQFKPMNQFGGWTDSYEAVLPYWRSTFDTIVTEFFDDLPESWGTTYRFAIEEILKIILHLCEPDFRLRGDLKDSKVNPAKYSLSRIISKLDNLRLRVRVKSRVN